MSSLLLEAILGGDCGLEQALEGAFGLIKLGDFLSDILFIVTLSKFDSILGDVNNMANEEFKINALAYLIATVCFTIVGIVFDFTKAIIFLRNKKSADDEDDLSEEEKRNKKRKKQGLANINFWFEDFPQFCILMAFIGSAGSDEFLPCKTYLDPDDDFYSPIDEDCTEEQREYISELERDALVSMIFTILVMIRVFFFCRRNGCCSYCRNDCNQEETNNNNVLTPSSSTNIPQVPVLAVHSIPQAVNQHVTETVHEDGSRIIRTEVLNPDGSKTVTISETRNPSQGQGEFEA